MKIQEFWRELERIKLGISVVSHVYGVFFSSLVIYITAVLPVNNDGRSGTYDT
jgi:hypothetical protein